MRWCIRRIVNAECHWGVGVSHSGGSGGTVVFAVTMFGLVVRGRRADPVLASESGDEWSAYAARVPGWVPRLSHRAEGI